MARLRSAASIDFGALVALFSESFSDYLLPMRLDAAALARHIEHNDISLDDSPVATVEVPAAFALLARRGADAWIGGMGTAPAYRRRGLGGRVTAAALEAARAHGCETVWLEVIDRNETAVSVYRRAGFEVVRDLDVWARVASGTTPPPGRSVEWASAHGWIAAAREAREPWQRSDATLERMHEGGSRLRAIAVDRGGETAGAAVFTEDASAVTVLQVAALDDETARDVLLASAGADRALRFTNVPDGDRFSRALARLGGRPLVRQHEMRLRLG